MAGILELLSRYQRHIEDIFTAYGMLGLVSLLLAIFIGIIIRSYIFGTKRSFPHQPMIDQHFEEDPEMRRTLNQVYRLSIKRHSCQEEGKGKKNTSMLSSCISYDYMNLLKAIDVINCLPGSLLQELCSHIERLHFDAGVEVCSPGDIHECAYIVLNGQVNMYIMKDNDKETLVKEVMPGDSIFSVLHFIDLMKNDIAFNNYSMSIRSIKETEIAILPSRAVKLIFEKHPNIIACIIKFGMRRLCQMIFDTFTDLGIPSQIQNDLETDCRQQNVEKTPLLSEAQQRLVNALNLTNPEFLDNIISVKAIPKNMILGNENGDDYSLVFILHGSLQVSNEREHRSSAVYLTFGEGEILAWLKLLQESSVTIRATEMSHIASISKNNLTNLIKQDPSISLSLAYSFTRKMPSHVRYYDLASNYEKVESGGNLLQGNCTIDSLYYIHTGRIHVSRILQNKEERIIDEFETGDLIGLHEFFHVNKEIKVFRATRNTNLTKIPSQLLNMLTTNYPEISRNLLQLLGEQTINHAKISNFFTDDHYKVDNKKQNMRTVAIIPHSINVPLANFTYYLETAVEDIASCIVLTSDVVKKKAKDSGWDNDNYEYNLYRWLDEQEKCHHIVIYKSDWNMSQWTEICVRQADKILIVCLNSEEPRLGELEKKVENMSYVVAQKDLIILHCQEEFVRPTRTSEWLDQRKWLTTHIHVRCPRNMLSNQNSIGHITPNLNGNKSSILPDFSRLARHVTGNVIGVIIGGGVERSSAGVGFVKSLLDTGVPVDYICGASFGAIVAAFYAVNGDITSATALTREFFKLSLTAWRGLMTDLTYPYNSLYTGEWCNNILKSFFGDLQIEDMVLPYFCTTTDISNSQMKVHRKGPVWRYIRAGLTLDGILPPMCDPHDGTLLMDGGYCSYIPADVMMKLGVKIIFAVDFASKGRPNFANYGDSLSGWWALWNRWNPFSACGRLPNKATINLRLTFLSAELERNKLKNNTYPPHVHYIAPHPDLFKRECKDCFHKLVEIYYKHGLKVINGMLEEKKIPGLPKVM